MAFALASESRVKLIFTTRYILKIAGLHLIL
jgi:hypothetical protein